MATADIDGNGKADPDAIAPANFNGN